MAKVKKGDISTACSVESDPVGRRIDGLQLQTEDDLQHAVDIFARADAERAIVLLSRISLVPHDYRQRFGKGSRYHSVSIRIVTLKIQLSSVNLNHDGRDNDMVASHLGSGLV